MLTSKSITYRKGWKTISSACTTGLIVISPQIDHSLVTLSMFSFWPPTHYPGKANKTLTVRQAIFKALTSLLLSFFQRTSRVCMCDPKHYCLWPPCLNCDPLLISTPSSSGKADEVNRQGIWTFSYSEVLITWLPPKVLQCDS